MLYGIKEANTAGNRFFFDREKSPSLCRAYPLWSSALNCLCLLERREPGQLKLIGLGRSFASQVGLCEGIAFKSREARDDLEKIIGVVLGCERWDASGVVDT